MGTGAWVGDAPETSRAGIEYAASPCEGHVTEGSAPGVTIRAATRGWSVAGAAGVAAMTNTAKRTTITARLA